MAKTLDYESIIDEATEKLERRYAEIQDELKPLRDEEREVAEAIKRIAGSYPSGYARTSRTAAPAASGASSSPRLTGEEREAQVLEVLSNNPDGLNGTQIAEQIGVSTATATKAINTLLEASRIVSEGERRNRKLRLV